MILSLWYCFAIALAIADGARWHRQSILRNDQLALHQKDDTFDEQSDIPAVSRVWVRCKVSARGGCELIVEGLGGTGGPVLSARAIRHRRSCSRPS
jgi:hypothetical protein